MATPVIGTGMPPTAALKKTHKLSAGDLGGDVEATSLKTQDTISSRPPLFIYNICALSHTRNQPPEFVAFTVDACPKGEPFSCKIFPGVVKERYQRPGTSEFRYEEVDGRKYATSLLNPDCFPGTDWEAQLIEGTTGNNDMTGMNMNALGVVWLEWPPDDPRTAKALARVRERVDRTMDALVKEGERLHAEGRPGQISAMMHFAMEYFGLSAAWHMSHRHKIECPNCGDMILEGIAYHRNASGDICIIDRERYEQSVIPSTKQTEAPDRKPRTRGTR